MAAVQTRSRSSSDPFGDDKGSPTSPRAPPPPPKKSKQPQKTRDIAEEVRDTVVVRGSPARVARSQTNAQSAPTRNAPQLGPRSLSQDSVPVDKAKKSSKKGSKHADVIDRLDYTGVGPMFHHDGPFDACAPSRNRQKNRAPMMAWTPRPEDAAVPKEYNDNPYPSPNAYSAFSPSEYDPPKKKVDAIAEAWGIHEPEPYEEFFAGGGGGTTGNTPASSIYNGKESSRKPAEPSRSRAHARRSQLPPPMPIFVPDGVADGVIAPDSPGSPSSFPKRNKSLMHRIRKMRDAPNVPVNDDEAVTDSSANGERPTHRSQNSFLGRFGNNGRTATNMSPTSEASETYVFIEPKAKDPKDLPPTPGSGGASSPPEHSNGYFDEPEAAPPSAGNGLGRKTSLMKKVGRVVRGTR
ncbi:Pal1 cell morphology protein-domain-containing protein [Mycena vitilis]|nr:Pal1 cell morphology protein-domain-containing protein [Mycena vitilis]